MLFYVGESATRGLLGLILLWGLAACGPTADSDLSYTDIDSEYLSDTLVAIASSRENSSTAMVGSTSFVAVDGSVARIDNRGLDGAGIVHAGGVLGFADMRHDYVLGAEPRVLDRKAGSDTAYQSYLRDGKLVTLLNAGFDDEAYELTVIEAGRTSSVRREKGFLMISAQCEDGIWAGLNPDLEEVTSSGSVAFRRVSPAGEKVWPVSTDYASLSMQAADCEGSRLLSAGVGEGDDEGMSSLLLDLDIASGASTAVRLDDLGGYTGDAGLEFDAIDLVGSRVRGVVVDPEQEKRALVSIDPASGKVAILAEIKSAREAVSLHVDFDDGYLYVLDITRDAPSRLRAYDPETGRLIASKTFDAIDSRINGRLTSFEKQQFVNGFAVIAPPERW